MSVASQPSEAHEVPSVPGHTIGFVETKSACDALTQALNTAGFPDAKILVLHGASAIHLLESLLGGSLWGESAEEVLKQGTLQLGDGHVVVCVEVENANEAATVASVSTQHGGYSIYHFGLLIDTRLTA